MKVAAKPKNETVRLEALRRLAILDTPPEERFDRVTSLVAKIFDVPMVLISLVDADRQWFKSRYGLSERETSRDISFCSHVVLQGEALVVTNTLQDERFADHPAVLKAPNVRFYAGYPLYTPEHLIAGTLCIINSKPREFGDDALELLGDYAQWAQHEMNSLELQRSFNIMSESEARFRNAFSHSPIGMALVGLDDNCLQANHALCHMMECSAQQLLQQGLSKLGHPDDAALDDEYRRDLLSGTITHYNIEKRYRLPDDRTVWTQASTSLVRDRNDQPVYYVLQLQDIGERKQLEQMKSDFLAAAAHELRSPMASVSGFTELLLDREFDATERREMLGIIHAQSQRMTHLINELLDLARIEAQSGRHFDFKQQAVEPVVRSAVQSFLPPEGRNPVELCIADQLPQVAMNAEKIHEVMTNLLSNAYRYSHQGNICVNVTQAGDELQISVSDQGMGISPDEIKQLFEPFFRSASARGVRGTGLGMTLVREIVKAHNGHIDVHSEIGKGTQIIVALPLA
ncbi:MAG: ATP-binding protein [Steroidobacteraceae bacterium]